MTEFEYARQRAELGGRVHEHDGVWWEWTAPFYSKPVFEFRAFSPRSARPSWPRSFVGYSHQVRDRKHGNRALEFMVLEGEDFREFGMKRLRSEKRNQVRKGLKHFEARLIDNLDSALEDMRQINVSQATRLMRDETFYLPPAYYEEHAEAWREEMRKRFSWSGREWWGAFNRGRLCAYMCTYQIEHVLFIELMKTHSEYLKLCATDAVYFTALERVSERDDCALIVNGGPGREGLNRYKEQFLFRRREYHYYASNPRLHLASRRVIELRDKVRSSVFRRLSRQVQPGAGPGHRAHGV